MTENNPFTENIVRVMDDFISHLNKTKKLFMILILSSFIIAPMSLIFAFILITPQVLTHAGEPYIVSLTAPGMMYENPQLIGSSVKNHTFHGDLISRNATGTLVTLEVVPFPDQEVSHIRGSMNAIPIGDEPVVYNKVIVSQTENQNTSESVWVVSDDIVVKYFPLKSFDIHNDEFSERLSFKFEKTQNQPKFLFLNDSSNLGKQFDVTQFIFIWVIISSILASFWIYVGIREYGFFSNWNKKYRTYMKLQEKIDKELGD